MTPAVTIGARMLGGRVPVPKASASLRSRSAAHADRLVIAAVQANPTVGDITRQRRPGARKAIAEAAAPGADVALFSELFLIGYPPEDLALKPAAVAGLPASARARWRRRPPRAARRWSTLPWPRRRTGGRTTPWRCSAGGEVRGVTFKVDLPNYGVFDEKRVFAAGERPGLFEVRGGEARRAGLRGHLGAASCARAEGRRRRDSCSSPTARPIRRTADDERLASPAPGSPRPACRSSTSTRWAARTNWCSTAARSPCRRTARSCMRLPMFEERAWPARPGRTGRRRLALRRGAA